MSFTFFDHTGDIGVDVDAATLEGLFGHAAAAFVQVVTHPPAVRPDTRIPVALAAPELDLLLRDWLSELLFRFETSGFLPVSVTPDITRDAAAPDAVWRLQSSVAGEAGAAWRLPIKVLIKAVTYHALEVRRVADGWHARVIFDI